VLTGAMVVSVSTNQEGSSLGRLVEAAARILVKDDEATITPDPSVAVESAVDPELSV